MTQFHQSLLKFLGICSFILSTQVLGSASRPRDEPIDPMLIDLAREARYAALTVVAPPLLWSSDEYNFWLDFIRNRFLEKGDILNYVTIAHLARYGKCGEYSHLALRYIANQPQWEGRYIFCSIAYKSDTKESKHQIIVAKPCDSQSCHIFKNMFTGQGISWEEAMEDCIILDPLENSIAPYHDKTTPFYKKYVRDTPPKSQAFYLASPLLEVPIPPIDQTNIYKDTDQKIKVFYTYLMQKNALYRCIATPFDDPARPSRQKAAAIYIRARCDIGQIQGEAALVVNSWLERDHIPHIPGLIALETSA